MSREESAVESVKALAGLCRAQLARQLGSITFEFKGTDLPTAVDEYVREYGITHIVVGRSKRPWYHRLFGPPLLDRLLRAVPGKNILLVDNSP